MELSGKTVVVTSAGGNLGSVGARQIARLSATSTRSNLLAG